MKLVKIFFIVVCLEGIVIFLWAFLTPPESNKIVFLWFSLPQLIQLSGIIGIWLVNLGIVIWLLRSTSHVDAILEAIDRWCLEEKQLAPFIIIFLTIPVLLLAVVIKIHSTPLSGDVYQTWAPVTFPLLYALVHRTLPLTLWILITALEVVIFLVVRYFTVVIRQETWAWQYLKNTVLGLFLAIAVIFHWIVLIFQLRFFVNIPAWYWGIDKIAFTSRDIWFALPVVLLVALSYWTLILKRHALFGLLLVFILGWFLQMGIGILTGGGVESLRARYFSTYHAIYPIGASRSRLTILETIQNYEEVYGNYSFTSTKPPGLMAFYTALEQLINGYPPAYSEQERFERISWTITYGFPVLSMLMVFVIYAFAKRFLQIKSGSIPLTASFLYIFCPNIILFSLFADQALYPFAFLIGIWLIIITVQKRSIIAAFFLGAFLYIAIFFAFTMLPLYIFTGIYLALDYWVNNKDRIFSQMTIAGAIAIGTLTIYLIFLIFLNYNFFPRFTKTVEINHNFDFYLRVDQQPPSGPESFQTRIQQIANAAWVNNLDFAAAVGFPIYILFIVQSITLVKRLVKNNILSGDPVLLALLFSFVVLNLAGTAQGEVARLWMFWVPMVVIFVSLEIEKLLPKKMYLFWGLILVQFITILLIYHFQDLKM